MEIRLVSTYVLFLFLLMSQFPLFAQKQPTVESLMKEFSAEFDSIASVEKSKSKLLQKKDDFLAGRNQATDSIQFARLLQQHDFAAMHQQRCFAWQFYSSIIIFIMVILIVIMGLVLSYKQFQLFEVQVKANFIKPKAEMTTIESESTTIEISQSGLKINTGVIGLAILFLSLAFFFLYLKYVYQIEVIDTSVGVYK